MSSFYIFDKTNNDNVSKNLDMKKYAINNLKTYPEDNADVTSKKYVDDENAKQLNLAGGVMTGILNMNGFIVSNIPAPYHEDHATRKKYVDDELTKKLSLTGGTMSGDLNMSNYSITNILKPTLAQSPTTKSYVDDSLAKKLSLTGGTMTGVLNTKRLTTVGFESSDSLSFRQFYIGHPNIITAGWFLGNQKGNPTNFDNDLYFTVRYKNGNLNTAGFISDSSSNVKMNFTGQHRCKRDSGDVKTLKPGMILECTGQYMNMFGDGDLSVPTINDAIPIVRVSNTVKSKAVFGVFSEYKDSESRVYRAGNFVSVYNKTKNDNRVFVNSLGEGGILVCNSAGSLNVGDYIESFKLGYGQKQKTGTLKNSTVAKITQDMDFSGSTETIDVDGKTYKVAFVGCTYHCG